MDREELERLVASEAAGWRRAQELDAEVRRLSQQLDEAWQHAHRLDTALQGYVDLLNSATYHSDALAVWKKAPTFLDDSKFMAAYRAGMDSGHHIARERGSREDIHIEWRVRVVCWAAAHASKLPGDFVECGVNTGIYSLAVCNYLGFNSLDREMWLFDTFAGIPVEQATDSERKFAQNQNDTIFDECYGIAQANFAPFPSVHLVRGIIPDTLGTVQIDKVAYLSLDLNILAPEIAALEYFWPKIVPGGVVVLDDYGWTDHPLQRAAEDAFARSAGTEILMLPTGQGLLLKPQGCSV